MSENTNQAVIYEQRDRVVVITMNRPEKHNAVNVELADALRGAVDRFETDETVLVCVLTGTGEKSFCAGMDLGAFERGDGPRIIEGEGGFAGFTARERTKPVIAAVNGFALGGGAEIMLACDMAYAADHARMGFPEVRHGLFAGAGGAIRLPRVIGRVRAMELLLTGRIIEAAEALDLGLLNAVVPAQELLPHVLSVAETIAANGPLAVRETLRLARAASEPDADLIRQNTQAWTRVSTSEDAAEGPKAFLEKREPQWRGR